MTTATAGPEDFLDMDEEHDQGDPLWEDRRARLGLYHERENGGLSQVDLPLTLAERARMGIQNDLNPSLQEREEAAEMEER
jgi:hypothetical protein